jgi:hypothetical protein
LQKYRSGTLLSERVLSYTNFLSHFPFLTAPSVTENFRDDWNTGKQNFDKGEASSFLKYLENVEDQNK